MLTPDLMPKTTSPHGGYRLFELSSDVQYHPEIATATILKAYRASGANLTRTAETLKVSARTLHRYVDKLDLQGKLSDLRDVARRDGWLRTDRWPNEQPARRPRGRSRSRAAEA